jgi:MerR family transcriptional regulator, light-induced transcriptional regulator
MPSDTEPRYPVRIVAQRSGVSPHVLRAWERRYHAVTPTRTEGGQRLYSDRDVERLRLLQRLTGRGHAIGRLARLPYDELEQIARIEESSGAGPSGSAPASAQAAEFCSAALDAARSLDPAELKAVLQRASISLGVPVFLDQVAGPSIRDIGHGWRDGTLSVGQEHLATAVFQQVLGWIIDAYHVDEDAPRMLAATPAGQLHELGALMAAAAAAAEGWNVLYLGPNLPASEIVDSARQAQVRGVALSIVNPTPDEGLLENLKLLRRELPSRVHLFLGGSAVAQEAERFSSLGAQTFTTLADFRSALRDLPASH